MNGRLKELRETLDLSQKTFAEKIGITGSMVSNLENGKRNITKHLIKCICTAYSVNEEWFENGSGEMFKSKQKDSTVLEDKIELIKTKLLNHRKEISLSEKEENILNFTNNVLSEESYTFKKHILYQLAILDESDWELIEQMSEIVDNLTFKQWKLVVSFLRIISEK